MQIRSFELADIPAVVQLRKKCFGSSSQATRQLAETRFRKVFFENPWYRKDISSLVAVDDTGNIIGFLGVVPRPMKYGEESIWMAAHTQLMADPDSNEVAGVSLLQAFINGPQDFSFADLANDESSKILGALGETVNSTYSFYWTRPLKPVQFALRGINLWKLPKLVVRAFGAVVDKCLVRQRNSRFYISLPDCRSMTVDTERLLALYGTFFRRYKIRPVYTEADLSWLLSDFQKELASNEKLRMREVADQSGRPLGWYLYCFQKGGAAQVLQFGGRPDAIDKVIASLNYDAYIDGAAYVSGRVQPEYLPQLSQPSIHFSRRGPWVSLGSKHSKLRGDILAGNAWLTRLEGEWWMNF